ncbi:MAG: hypothetical protein RIT26_1262 [Pseudomonadota bacterium]|jgi:hypothetical protein
MVSVGILMLDTRFPRPVGDIGHPDTWAAHHLRPLYRVVPGARPDLIVTRQAHTAWLAPFIEAAQALVRDGAQAITTSCGFLARHQTALQSAVPVPVVSSGLLWCRHLSHPGILTIDAGRLGPLDLQGAMVPSGTPVSGVDTQGEFYGRIMGNDSHMDLALAQADVVNAARTLVREHPLVRHIVLECTNMPPYRDAITAATGRTCHDVIEGVALALAGQVKA